MGRRESPDQLGPPHRGHRAAVETWPLGIVDPRRPRVRLGSQHGRAVGARRVHRLRAELAGGRDGVPGHARRPGARADRRGCGGDPREPTPPARRAESRIVTRVRSSAGMPERRAWDRQPRFASRSDPADRIEGDTGPRVPDSQRGSALTRPIARKREWQTRGPSVHRAWNLFKFQAANGREGEGRSGGDSGTLAAIRNTEGSAKRKSEGSDVSRNLGVLHGASSRSDGGHHTRPREPRFVVPLRGPVLSCALVRWGRPTLSTRRQSAPSGVNHQPRPASQSDDPDPTGPGGR
jgi:hypothetical protein